MPLSDRPYGPSLGGSSPSASLALNVQATNPGGPTAGPLPVTQAITSTAETLILGYPIAAAVALFCALGPDTTLEQSAFDLYISGIIQTSNTTNVTLKVYQGLVISAGQLLGSSGAIAQNGTSLAVQNTASFIIHAQLIFDSVSGVLAGKIEFYVNKTVVAFVTLSNFVAGFLNVGNPNANPPTVSNLPVFCLSLTSSAATALLPTTITVSKFSAG